MANFTKKEIKKTFIKLLNEKPLNKISVKDIVDGCGVSRNTFYYYYEDITALLEDIIVGLSDDFVKNRPSFDTLEQCVDAIFNFALENKRAVLHIYRSLGREIYDGFLTKACEYAVTEYINALFADLDTTEEEKKAIIKFVKCSLVGVCIDWIRSGMKNDYIDDYHRFSRMCKGFVDEFAKQHKRKA